jgi:dipeptidyl aminopeptidase/acylaminoacyl peptidase
MKLRLRVRAIALKGLMLAAFVLAVAILTYGQGTVTDYERAQNLRKQFEGAVTNLAGRATWIERTNRFWYRRSNRGENEFIQFDAETMAKTRLFDHERLATSLSAAAGQTYKPFDLPFSTFTFVNNGSSIQFNLTDNLWRCDLSNYVCTRVERRPGAFQGPGGRNLDPWRTSPDGTLEAYIKNYNLFVRTKDKKEDFPLSFDGSEDNYYDLNTIVWSPDGKMIAAYRVRPGYHRKIQYIQSSPLDQLQPKYTTIEYAKPGDTLDVEQPVLFVLSNRQQIVVDNSLFPNAYEISNPVWRKDSHAFTFEYNQRGHQIFRIVEVNAATGKARALVTEESKTFFCYSGKRYRFDVNDGREIVWMSERDGWNHLYLMDPETGAVKNQITKGNWVVRGVEKVDEQKRQIWFRASGMYPGKDPYFNYYYRINFDGTGLTRLTEAEGNHTVAFSSDMKYYVDTWSRIDLPTVSQLRSVADGKVIQEIERAGIEDLVKVGWRAPEVFTSTGRDGKTDIWGIIIRPTNFDPKKKYPVIEYIYAGPQDSFVPKSFSAYSAMQAQAELGFIVVQVDGMGTSNRSKAFHDVCWKNLGDAGFPDRILWHKAIAAKYSYYDISRVGIYGHSAGGQNALGALLFHPEFYKACVSSCGCHDNRMDKIWWNEQWMGWPLGTEYAASSNVDNAYRLRGKLLLSVGEMDQNVDPASTMQVVNALIKAKKTFDLIVLPGQGHSPGGEYGERKRFDFFVHHLLGVEPPDWNTIDSTKTSSATSSLN